MKNSNRPFNNVHPDNMSEFPDIELMHSEAAQVISDNTVPLLRKLCPYANNMKDEFGPRLVEKSAQQCVNYLTLEMPRPTTVTDDDTIADAIDAFNAMMERFFTLGSAYCAVDPKNFHKKFEPEFEAIVHSLMDLLFARKMLALCDPDYDPDCDCCDYYDDCDDCDNCEDEDYDCDRYACGHELNDKDDCFTKKADNHLIFFKCKKCNAIVPVTYNDVRNGNSPKCASCDENYATPNDAFTIDGTTHYIKLVCKNCGLTFHLYNINQDEFNDTCSRCAESLECVAMEHTSIRQEVKTSETSDEDNENTCSDCIKRELCEQAHEDGEACIGCDGCKQCSVFDCPNNKAEHKGCMYCDQVSPDAEYLHIHCAECETHIIACEKCVKEKELTCSKCGFKLPPLDSDKE